MKKTALIMTLFVGLNVFAKPIVYTNYAGCKVEVENLKGGVVFSVFQEKQSEVISLTLGSGQGRFSYCDKNVMQIQNFQSPQKGDVIVMSCNEHQNSNGTNKGQVEINMIGGELTKLSVDGFVKKLFRWRQDTSIDCPNLVRK